MTTSRTRRRVEPAAAAVNLTVEEAATVIGIGRTYTYNLIKAGSLRAFKCGRLTRVPRIEAERLAREMAA